MHAGSYISPKCAVERSRIHGSGVFARERIPKGELIGIFTGRILGMEEMEDLRSISQYPLRIHESLFLLPKNNKPDAPYFINHSCDPNAGMKGQVILVARRAIEPGEEITYDYETTDTDLFHVCHCGAALCRGEITGQAYKDSLFQKRHAGFFTWYMQQKVDELHRMPIPEHLELRTSSRGEAGVFLTKDVKQNDVVLSLAFENRITAEEAESDTIQIDDNFFLAPKNGLSLGINFVGHSCEPTVRIDFDTLTFVALRDLKKGEEVTYNCLTTEENLDDYDEDFECTCSSPHCFGTIHGFKYLTRAQQQLLQPLLSPFLQKKMVKDAHKHAPVVL